MRLTGDHGRALRAATAYFALVFLVGFVLGVLRISWAVPRFGVRVAELAEQPLMLITIVLAARWVIRRFDVPAEAGHRLLLGTVALALLLAVELTVVLALQGLTLREYFDTRDPVSGAVYAAMLVVFAAMPSLVRRKS